MSPCTSTRAEQRGPRRRCRRCSRPRTGNLDDLRAKLEKGDLDAVIDIPAGMDSAWARSAERNVQVYYDASQTVNQQMLIPAPAQVINAHRRADRRVYATDRHEPAERPVPRTEVHRFSAARHTGHDADVHRRPGRTARHPAEAGPHHQAAGFHAPSPVDARHGGSAVPHDTSSWLTAALIILVGRLVFDVQMVGNWFSLLRRHSPGVAGLHQPGLPDGRAGQDRGGPPSPSSRTSSPAHDDPLRHLLRASPACRPSSNP